MRRVQSLSCSSKFRLSRLLAEWNLSVCAALLPRGLVSHVRIHWIAENSSRDISNSLNRECTRTSQWQSLGLIRLGSFLGSADGKIHEHIDRRQGGTIDDHIDGRRTLVSNLRHYRWPHRWTPGRHYRWPHRRTPTHCVKPQALSMTTSMDAWAALSMTTSMDADTVCPWRWLFCCSSPRINFLHNETKKFKEWNKNKKF